MHHVGLPQLIQTKTAELVFELNASFSKCWCRVHVAAQAGGRWGFQSVTAAVPRFEPPCGRVLDMAEHGGGLLHTQQRRNTSCRQPWLLHCNAADAATHTCASCFPACDFTHPGVLADDLEHQVPSGASKAGEYCVRLIRYAPEKRSRKR